MTVDPAIAGKRLLLVGCGHMGGAMLTGWLRGGLAPDRFTVLDPASPDLPHGVRYLQAPPEGETFDVVLLAIKPQGLPEAAPTLEPLIGPETTLLSILAGISLEKLAAAFPRADAIVRVMPNLAAALGKSPIALATTPVDDPARKAIDALMQPLGQVEWLGDEALMDAVTALAGSGPAFFYRFIDAMAHGGAMLGLEREQAERMALATARGAVALAAQGTASPADLARKVTSKGGTTEAGLAALDGEDRLQKLVFRTLQAAAQRAEVLRGES